MTSLKLKKQLRTLNNDLANDTKTLTDFLWDYILSSDYEGEMPITSDEVVICEDGAIRVCYNYWNHRQCKDFYTWASAVVFY